MRLDETERAKQRWQYWLGRAQRALAGAPDDTTPPTENPWDALANDRQYYGFLAAESLGTAPALNDQSTRPTPKRSTRCSNVPPMQRLSELYAIGDRADARREWAMLLPNLDPSRTRRCRVRHCRLGWIDLSIMAANAADLRDDLSLRFPVRSRRRSPKRVAPRPCRSAFYTASRDRKARSRRRRVRPPVRSASCN